MKSFRPHFYLSKAQRNALLILSILLIVSPFIINSSLTKNNRSLKKEKMGFYQKWIDSIKGIKPQNYSSIYPFNPNYLTDYRAYTLGLSIESIDRLMAFRKEGNYIRSAGEFKRVTAVDDSLFKRLKPLLKFPNAPKSKKTDDVWVKKKEINSCQASDLIKVYGIGETLSKRIIKYRKFLGGFASLDQLYEVYGLDSVVVDRLIKKFEITISPKLEKVQLSNASLSDLEAIPYLNRQEAKKIIRYRTLHPSMVNEDLHKIADFDTLKIKRISLYLY